MTEHFDQSELFEPKRTDQNQYSTFIQELQESTEKLMNQVFNANYIPEIDRQDLQLNDLENFDQSKSSLFDSTKATNKNNFNGLNSTKISTATRCTQREKSFSESFANFLIRNDKWKERRIMRIKNEHNKKEEDELKSLTFIPTILKLSRQKIMEPIYQRCLDIQKQKLKKITLKRIQKQRQENKKQSQNTYQPIIKNKAKNRTLEEYLKDKEEWNKKKIQYIENEKLWQEARKNQECIFRPILISKKFAKNLKQSFQRVEDRLLQSLEKSIEKKQEIKNKVEESHRNQFKKRGEKDS